jgi:hypothetical protein
MEFRLSSFERKWRFAELAELGVELGSTWVVARYGARSITRYGARGVARYSTRGVARYNTRGVAWYIAWHTTWCEAKVHRLELR